MDTGNIEMEVLIMTIRELRKDRKLSQTEFAKSIGIGLSSIAAYEAGKRNPSPKVLEKIQEVYGVMPGSPAPAEQAEVKDATSGKKAAKATKKASAGKEKTSTGKSPRKSRSAKKASEPQIIIQSPLGGEITPFAIIAKVGPVDKIYIRVDKNKAYWVKGNETGSIDLW